jgi:hypothetical protein
MTRYFFIICALCFLIYANTLGNAFVLDDYTVILNNPDITWLFKEANPVTIAHSFNYLIGGVNPAGYHFLNITLHAVNGILVFLVLSLFFHPLPSLFGSLIFISHPVQTESVSWISGRPYPFMALFLLTAFIFYLDSTKKAASKTKAYLLYIISTLAYCLALLTTFFALCFPALLVLYDCVFDNWRRKWKFWAVFFALACVRLFAAQVMIKHRVTEMAANTGVTRWTFTASNMAKESYRIP